MSSDAALGDGPLALLFFVFGIFLAIPDGRLRRTHVPVHQKGVSLHLGQSVEILIPSIPAVLGISGRNGPDPNSAHSETGRVTSPNSPGFFC